MAWMKIAGRGLVAVGAAVAGLMVTGCGETSTNPVMRNPMFAASFSAIHPDEVDIVRGEMDRAGATEVEELVFDLPLQRDGAVSVEQLCKQIERWHSTITSIRNDAGAQIAANDVVEVRFRYVSSRAESGSGATVFIERQPADARLYLDTYVTDIVAYTREDGSVALNDGMRFQAALPFSYIRETDRIYFHTSYRGSTRYFYYDIAAQSQTEVAGIRNRNDWQYYIKHGELPPKKDEK